MVLINIPGKIISGDYQGHYVFVEPFEGDEKHGYLIFIAEANCWSTENQDKTHILYDDYARNFESVELAFEMSQWEIEWLKSNNE